MLFGDVHSMGINNNANHHGNRLVALRATLIAIAEIHNLITEDRRLTLGNIGATLRQGVLRR